MIKVLNIGPDVTVKGGMTSVVKNYMDFKKWDNTEFNYYPSYVEKGNVGMAVYYFKSVPKIIKAINEKSIDIVHLHMSERGSYFRKALLLEICKFYKKKVIIHHHGAEFYSFYNNRNKIIKKMIRATLRKADLNIVLSKRLINDMKGVEGDIKITYLYNAVNVEENNPYNNNGKQAMFLGRLGKRKGTYDLIDAIKLIDTRLPADIRFNLCGDGEVDSVKQLVKEKSISHRINHIGWVDKELKETLLKETIINVLPSYNEGLPMTILETMAHGIPNLSTSIASIPEVIHHENGSLIEPGDVESLGDELVRLCSDDSLRESMSNESHKIIFNDFSLFKHIKELEEIYAKVMNSYD